MRKKVDSRIRTLVENCVKLKQRSLLIIIGDKARDQVVNLHYMLSKTVVKARPSVLWCYKKDLHLSSHRKKRVNQVKKMMQRGLLDPEKEDPFALFVASTNIRYCYYNETHNILGSTYGMCVLQDFEAITPNLLARTLETVEGGGMIVMLLSNLKSLTQLYTLTMDVHARLRTEAHNNVTGRFNERMVLSLASCPHCLLMDDELNILPTSSLVRSIEPVPLTPEGTPVDMPGQSSAAELSGLVDSLNDTQPAGSLVGKCRTLDQARAVLTFLDAASEKTLRSTVALTAARGRGKSAAMGLAIAGAIGLGYSNIFVTAPSPENLKTLFQFIFTGLDALGYKEHIDYDLVESTNPALNKAVVRVNIFRQHRQTVQYIQPQHHANLAQAELVVIDEAAAIPLPIVKAMLGPYLVFLCSTINGYEGTGRSLSLKLLQQLREQQGARAAAPADAKSGEGAGVVGRSFREVTLNEPIRYSQGDPIESWLHQVLCLDAATHLPRPPAKLPHPDDCQLYYVERDTLFSFHKASEAFLQQMVALFVASHYKNTPNDLLLMADAPAHQLFVLLAPLNETQNVMPDVLCAVQVALEGEVSRKSAFNSLGRGDLPQGDLIPWTVGQQFQDPDFPSLSGARVVRIAVHPELGRAGYGTRALELLRRYYEGAMTSLSEDEGDEDVPPRSNNAPGRSIAPSVEKSVLLEEQIKPRIGLPPLFTNLTERKSERLHYLGVSYGLTETLFNFWHKNAYEPVYLRQNASDITGEHTMIMLRPLQSPDVQEGTEWVRSFVDDFKLRFMTLMSGAFSAMSPVMALTILHPKVTFSEEETRKGIQQGVRVVRGDGSPLTPYDLKRLQAYSNNLVDYHLILDLLPSLARSYFRGHIPATLSYSQAAILLTLGLQNSNLERVEQELKLPPAQVLALFNKAVRKVYGHLRASQEEEAGRSLPAPRPSSALIVGGAHNGDVDEELDAAARAVREQMKDMFKAEELQQYAIKGSAERFEEAASGKAPVPGALVNVKSAGEKNTDGGKGEKAAALYKRDGKRKKFNGQQQKGGKKFKK